MGIEIDNETANRVAVCVLKTHLEYIYEREHDHKVNGTWYPSEDKEYNRKLEKSLKRVLRYFGEDL